MIIPGVTFINEGTICSEKKKNETASVNHLWTFTPASLQTRCSRHLLEEENIFRGFFPPAVVAFPVGAAIVAIRLLTIHPQSLSKSLLCLSTPVLCPKLLPPIPTSPVPRTFLLSVLESEGRLNFPRGITTIALHSLRSYRSPKNLIKSNPPGRQFLYDEHVLKRLTWALLVLQKRRLWSKIAYLLSII